LIGRDNEAGARYWAPYLLAIPEVLHGLHITREPHLVSLTLASPGGPETIDLLPFEPVQIMTGDIATRFNRRAGWIDVRDLSNQPDPIWLRQTGETWHFEHLGDLLYVQLNQITNKSDETLVQFALRLKSEIANRKPKKLVLDLRLNRGGDGTLIPPVVRAIIQSEGIDRKGHFFAVIGPATFSAAQMLVDALEKYTNVTFIGEPSGSKGNAYGDSRKIALPNSGLTVRASVYYWQEWHPQDRREATIPEIPAVLTFDAYRANLDPALQIILQSNPQD
jgi:hypothetical protein